MDGFFTLYSDLGVYVWLLYFPKFLINHITNCVLDMYFAWFSWAPWSIIENCRISLWLIYFLAKNYFSIISCIICHFIHEVNCLRCNTSVVSVTYYGFVVYVYVDNMRSGIWNRLVVYRYYASIRCEIFFMYFPRNIHCCIIRVKSNSKCPDVRELWSE